VRWPARPAELRAGLDFFVTFCIKAKSNNPMSKQKKERKDVCSLSKYL
jgi:hypothetical protein